MYIKIPCKALTHASPGSSPRGGRNDSVGLGGAQTEGKMRRGWTGNGSQGPKKKPRSTESPPRQEPDCRITKFLPNSEKARAPESGPEAPSGPAWSLSAPVPKPPQPQRTRTAGPSGSPDPSLGPLVSLFPGLGHFYLVHSYLS